MQINIVSYISKIWLKVGLLIRNYPRSGYILIKYITPQLASAIHAHINKIFI